MGAQLRLTRRRIRSVQSTMKITRAMELIAASRIVRAQRRVEESLPYAERIRDAMAELSGVTEVATFPLLAEREVRTVGILGITSDRGLAGSYNANVIRVIENAVAKARREDKAFRLHLAGKKGLSYFRFRGYPISSSALGVSDMPRYEDATEIGLRVMAEYEAGEIDQLLVCHTAFRSAVTQHAASVQVLPIVRREKDRAPGEVPAGYEFAPDPEKILAALLPRYVVTLVYAAMLESSASEHAARRRAMKVATDNAEDLIQVLTRQANRLRQAEITTEIMDIVGGAEALRKQEIAAEG